MKYTLILLGSLILGLSVLGCSDEVAHKETDHANLTGGRTHTSETVTENPNGTLNKSETKTKY